LTGEPTQRRGKEEVEMNHYYMDFDPHLIGQRNEEMVRLSRATAWWGGCLISGRSDRDVRTVWDGNERKEHER
jgi:hypothetical protein